MLKVRGPNLVGALTLRDMLADHTNVLPKQHALLRMH